MSLEHIDLDQIQDVEQAKKAIVMLFNLVEDLQTTVRQLQVENQRLRDEVNRLKGEKGQPDIQPNQHGQRPGQGRDHSSEAERRKPQEWHKGSKLDKIKIDCEEVLRVDRVQLPGDAQLKGYEDTIIQDVVIHTDNVLYRRERYYSPGERQKYLAQLSPGYGRQFGPGIKALALVQYCACNMADPKIREFFIHVGVLLRRGSCPTG